MEPVVPEYMSRLNAEAAAISVVVPVYDTPDLDALVRSIVEALGARDFEIVLVDDASPDASIWPSLERLARADRRVRAFQFTRNAGQQAATLYGLREARGDLVVTMDDDLQHDPADIATLLAHSQHDVVIGEFRRRRHHVIRRFVSRIKGLLDRILLGKPGGLTMTSFRLLNRNIVDGIVARERVRPFLPALIFEITRDVVGVPVRHNRRISGRSGYTIGKTMRLVGDIIFSRRTWIPRALMGAGVSFVACGAASAGLVAYLAITGDRPVTRVAFAGAVFFAGGASLLGIGILGDSLARDRQQRSEPLASLVARRTPPPSEVRDRFDDARLFCIGE